jgi:hypothetical protein
MTVMFVLVVDVTMVAVDSSEPVIDVVTVVTFATTVVTTAVEVTVSAEASERRIVDNASVPILNSGSDPTIHPVPGPVR